MKRIFNTNYNHRSLDIALLILRAGISFCMLHHGLSKLNTVLSGAEIQFMDPVGLGIKTSFYLVLFAEVVCSLLLFIGLATRFALIPLMIDMLVAVFIVHVPDGFQKQELGILYLLVFVFIMASGPGRYSIDSIISKNVNRRRSY